MVRFVLPPILIRDGLLVFCNLAGTPAAAKSEQMEGAARAVEAEKAVALLQNALEVSAYLYLQLASLAARGLTSSDKSCKQDWQCNLALRSELLGTLLSPRTQFPI